MAEHVASCQCGGLTLRATQDPEAVMACSCTRCQKRTGAPYGAAGYFRREATSVTGVSKVWTREGSSGGSLDFHFCPTCGTTLYWTLELLPGRLGVALGCFETPLPEPSLVVWTQHKQPWVDFPAHWQVYEQSMRRR